MTLSLAAVFIPVLFMGGLIGRLFREFAVTIGAAVLVSGLHRPDADAHAVQPLPEAAEAKSITAGPISSPSGSSSSRLRFYERTLRAVLAHRHAAMLFSVATLAATVWLFMRIPKGFLPSEDRAQIMGSTEAVEGISYKSMFEHQQAVAAILRDQARVAVVHVQRRRPRQLRRATAAT